jgi:curved DNA-binding protein CbpA
LTPNPEAHLTRGAREDAILTPKPIAGVDIRALPIGPAEAFVLSRVDGRSSDVEIALVVGQSAADVQAILRRLSILGAVAYGSAASDPPTSGTASRSPSVPPGAEPERSSGTHAKFEPVIREARRPPMYDEALLEEVVGIEGERKRLILDTFFQLERLNHYEIFDVAPDAEKKLIKAAYFNAVATFHPDKYFGKALGAFKPKLEKIFQRVTEAHDVLTRAERRTAYDRYLESQRATRALDDAVDESAQQADIEAIRREIEREALQSRPSDRPSAAPPRHTPAPDGANRSASPSTAPAARGASPSSGPPQRASTAPPATAVSRPAPSAEERRRALARKLGGSIPPPAFAARAAPSEPPQPVPGAREAAAERLRRQYESGLARARDERVARFVQQADAGVAAKNFVAAANALRIAVSLSPDDKSLSDRFEAVDQQASAALADRYLEQARYEEREGHLVEAAHAYERVLRGRPSAQVYERAAHCLLEARSDLKKAGDWARTATELAPRETAYRITLARVYARAGMEQSALGELERARTLDPSDDTVKDWIKRVKRGEV